MSMETVVVRDHDGVFQALVHDDWITLMLLGSLSADPTNRAELAAAMLRYQRDEGNNDLVWIESDALPETEQWVCLDLLTRTVSAAEVELPQNPATYSASEGDPDDETQLVWMNLPPGWSCREAADWAQTIAPAPKRPTPLDARQVLYGESFARAIGRRALDTFRWNECPQEFYGWNDGDYSDDEKRRLANLWHAHTVRVHADWLMTPRCDLGGDSPRDWLHSARDWVEKELHNRSTQWSREHLAPPALGRDSDAYRFGPCGMHELVIYFYFCRMVIEHAWRTLTEKPNIELAPLTDLLQRHGRQWLQAGSLDGDPTPPAKIIEFERLRLPLTSADCGHVHQDEDCALCQLAAENDLLEFVQFSGDSLELDSEFAFSCTTERSEWEFQFECDEIDDKQETRRQRENDRRLPLRLAMAVADLQERLEVEDRHSDADRLQAKLDNLRLVLQQAERTTNDSPELSLAQTALNQPEGKQLMAVIYELGERYHDFARRIEACFEESEEAVGQNARD